MIVVLALLAGLLLAFANGANDNFKGVAVLYGSGTTSYRHASTSATLTTAAGSLAGDWSNFVCVDHNIRLFRRICG